MRRGEKEQVKKKERKKKKEKQRKYGEKTVKEIKRIL